MNRLLRPRIWPSFRASSGLAPCDVLNKYASGPSPCGCPVARPSPRSRCGASCIMRVKAYPLRSRKVEAVKVHDLVPRRYKVVHELLLGVLTAIDLRDGPELGVRTEDEVDTGAGPLEFARGAITTFEHVCVFRGCLPRRAHVEQIHEEVIGERLRALGEDAVPGPSEVGLQDAQAAHEHRHFGC